MKERSKNILEAAIESFIKFGEPISSNWLYQQYDFGIKPAMIRHELEELTEEGFLEQPYRSAGRIPSDIGYEFFIEKILDQKPEDGDDEILIDHDVWPTVTSWISGELRTLGVLSQIHEKLTLKVGLEKLINRLSWESPSELREIIRDFEALDERIEKIEKFIDNTVKVFIGKKSPVTRSRNLSVVMRSCSSDEGPVILMAIGPKRMDYKKAVKTLTDIKKIKNEKRRKK